MPAFLGSYRLENEKGLKFDDDADGDESVDDDDAWGEAPQRLSPHGLASQKT